MDNLRESDGNSLAEVEVSEDVKLKKKKVVKTTDGQKGIIYLSYIPDGMKPNHVRQIMSQFGQVERIFLQPDKRVNKRDKKGKKKKKMVNYTEGWVEFSKKKIAKRVADMLNGSQVGGKRKYKFYDSIWSIKYLRK